MIVEYCGPADLDVRSGPRRREWNTPWLEHDVMYWLPHDMMNENCVIKLVLWLLSNYARSSTDSN